MKRMLSSLKILGTAAIAAAAVGVATPVQAGSFDAIDQGYYSRKDGVVSHDKTKTRIAVGKKGARNFRSFMAFDLGGVTDPIKSAKLTFKFPGLFEDNSAKTFSLFDVNAPIGLLRSGQGGAVTKNFIFNDLGTGESLGSTVISVSDQGKTIEIDINQTGIDLLNDALGGKFAFGADLTGIGGSHQELLAGVGRAQLSVESIPTPALLPGLIGMGAAALRKKRAAALEEA